MKKYVGFLIVIPVLISCSSLYHTSESDKPCEVLLPSINEKYEGYCKKGLAHGEGKASGLHVYEGQFSEGLPDGKGTYIWRENRVYEGNWYAGKQNGFGVLKITDNEETEITSGFWLDGELAVLSDDDRPFQITQKQGNVSPVIRKHGEDYLHGRIKITVKRNGDNVAPILSDFSINHSTGHMPDAIINDLDGEFMIESVNFPTEVYVTYKIPGYAGVSSDIVRLRIQITEPGFWLVELNNK